MRGRHSGLQAGTAIDHAHRGQIRTEGPADVDLTIGHQDTNGSSKSSVRRKPSPRNAPAQLVEAFLQYALAGGAIAVAVREEKARGAELIGEHQTITNSKVFKAAKAALHIQSRRFGFGPGAVWSWALPAPPSAPIADGLPSPSPVVPVSATYDGDRSPTRRRRFHRGGELRFPKRPR